MNILQKIIDDTLEHESALYLQLEHLAAERKEVKRTIRALARYRKSLNVPPPALPGLDEPEQPLLRRIEELDAAANGPPVPADAATDVTADYEQDEPEDHGEPVEDYTDELPDPRDQPRPDVTASGIPIPNAKPKRRKRS